MSANLCLIAWNEPIGTPNCSRSLAYSSVMSKICCAVPTHLERERDGRLLHDPRGAPARSRGPGRRGPGRRSTSTPSSVTVREAAAAVERGDRVDRRARRRRRRTRRPRRRRSCPATRATTTTSSRPVASITPCFTPGERVAAAVGRRRGRGDVGRVERCRSPRRSRACRRAPAVGDRPEEARLLLGGAGSRTAGTNWVTVGSSGPGASARPSSSATTASSTAPSPRPPSASGTVSAGQPSSTMCAHRPSAGAACPRCAPRRAPATSAGGHSAASTARTRVAQLVLVGGEVELHGGRTLPDARRQARACRASTQPSGERGAVDLLHRGERERVDDASASGSLYAGELVARERRGGRRASAACAGSRGTTTATPISPITGSARGTTATAATPGCVGQHRLDLDRVDVVAAADVHLLAATDEAEPAVVVDPAEVAGAHEAVGGERGARSPRGRASSPLMTAGERRHTRPTSPAGDRRRRSSSTASSTAACGRPTLTTASSSGSSNAVPSPMPASVHE